LKLLERYLHDHSEEAFATLVHRYLDLVYSAALRQVRSPQLAEEVAQSVFTDLSKNAGRMKLDSPLSAWLYHVTRRTAVDVVRREVRAPGARTGCYRIERYGYASLDLEPNRTFPRRSHERARNRGSQLRSCCGSSKVEACARLARLSALSEDAAQNE
jgi:RNA polymerase sigma factor (sigma-70 family)